MWPAQSHPHRPAMQSARRRVAYSSSSGGGGGGLEYLLRVSRAWRRAWSGDPLVSPP